MIHRKIFFPLRSLRKIIIPFIILFSIVALVYAISNRDNFTRLTSLAISCTQGKVTTPYGYYYTFYPNSTTIDNKWVCNQSNKTVTCGGKNYCCFTPGKEWSEGECECTQSKVGTDYKITNGVTSSVCSAANKNKTTTCNSQVYCCPGPGKKWVKGKCPECVNGTEKKEDMIEYVCKNNKWVRRNCDVTCPYPDAPTVTCNGDTYCCLGAGKKWEKCITDTSTPGTKPPTAAPTGTGKKPSPPKQKKQKASKTPTKASAKQGCNDNKCQSVAQGKLWGLNNCEGDDPDGDMQLCNAKGRIGECRGKKYCCPGSGQKWTLDMTACPVTEATLTVIPLELTAGQSLTATWSGIPAPSTTDWLGMYKQGETDERNDVDWNYVNSANTCTKAPGDGKTDGTCLFAVPTSVATGSYELRLFSSDSYAKLATSNLFTIVGAVTPTPSGSITPSPTPSTLCCACPSPTPYYSQSMCNGACMTSFNCTSGQVCLLADTYGWVCRNPACVDSASCSCTAVISTPTPTTGSVKLTCDEPCSATTQCKTGYRCVYLNDQDISVCRNPKCFSSGTCSCPRITPTSITKGTDLTSPTPISTLSGTPTPTGLRLNALPTLTPTPTIAPINPSLVIKPFTDKTGKAPQKFTLTGTSDPFADIDIRFDPDSLGQTTTADAKGSWRYILTKSLSTGNKELTVTARTSDGGETQVKQSFTVKGGKSFFSLFIGFFILACIGGIGFFIYQKQMNDQSSLFSQFPPIPSSSEVTEAPPETQESSPGAPESKPDTIPSEPFITPSGEATPVEESSDMSEEFKPPIS